MGDDNRLALSTAAAALAQHFKQNEVGHLLNGIEDRVRNVQNAALMLGQGVPVYYIVDAQGSRLVVSAPFGCAVLLDDSSGARNAEYNRGQAAVNLDSWSREYEEAPIEDDEQQPPPENALQQLDELMHDVEESFAEASECVKWARRFRDDAAFRCAQEREELCWLHSDEGEDENEDEDSSDQKWNELAQSLHEFAALDRVLWEAQDAWNEWEDAFGMIIGAPVQPGHQINNSIARGGTERLLHPATPVSDDVLAALESAFLIAADKALKCLRALRNAVAACLDVVVDDERFEVRWSGKKCTMGPTQEFRMLQVLVTNKGRYMSNEHIAEQTGDDCLRTLKHIKGRLAKSLRAAGMEALADGISAVAGYYGLFVRSA